MSIKPTFAYYEVYDSSSLSYWKYIFIEAKLFTVSFKSLFAEHFMLPVSHEIVWVYGVHIFF